MYTGQIDKDTKITDMAMRPDPARSYPGRTYRFHTGPQVFPAFHGLSYTTFQYTLQQHSSDSSSSVAEEEVVEEVATVLSAKVIDADLRNSSLHRFSSPRLISLTATVKNTGGRAAPTSVLAFVAGPAAGTNGEPIRERERVFGPLFNMKRVILPRQAWDKHRQLKQRPVFSGELVAFEKVHLEAGAR